MILLMYLLVATWFVAHVARARRLGLDGDLQCCLDAAVALHTQASEFARVRAWLDDAGEVARVTADRRELTFDTHRGPLVRLPSAVQALSQWREREVALFGVETALHVVHTSGAWLRTVMHEDIDGARTLTAFLSGGGAKQELSPPPHHHPSDLIVCSLNAWHFTEPYAARLPRMRALVAGCHVVALQEMRYRWSAKGSAQSRWMMSDFVQSDTAAWHWSRAMTYFEGPFHHDEGLAVMQSNASPYAIADTQTVFLSRDPHDEQDEHQRVLLRARLVHRHTGTALHVFVTHMSLSLAAQRRNAVEIVREMRRHDGAQLLMGDLNGTPHEDMYRFLTGKLEWQGVRGDLTDMWPLRHGADAGLTFPAWQPVKRIDFMMMRAGGNISVAEMRLVGRSQSKQSTASDHMGLIAELRME